MDRKKIAFRFVARTRRRGEKMPRLMTGLVNRNTEAVGHYICKRHTRPKDGHIGILDVARRFGNADADDMIRRKFLQIRQKLPKQVRQLKHMLIKRVALAKAALPHRNGQDIPPLGKQRAALRIHRSKRRGVTARVHADAHAAIPAHCAGSSAACSPDCAASAVWVSPFSRRFASVESMPLTNVGVSSPQ